MMKKARIKIMAEIQPGFVWPEKATDIIIDGVMFQKGNENKIGYLSPYDPKNRVCWFGTKEEHEKGCLDKIKEDWLEFLDEKPPIRDEAFWQRVIDEKRICEFWDINYRDRKKSTLKKIEEDRDLPFKTRGDIEPCTYGYRYCEPTDYVLKEVYKPMEDK